MHQNRAISLAALSAVAVVFTACSTTISGQARTDRGPSQAGTSGSAQASPTDAAGLASLLERGLGSITSVHLQLDVAASLANVHGAGDETVANGTLTTLDLSESIEGFGTLRLRIVGDQTYAGLPPAQNHSGKPWIVVSDTSTDPIIKALHRSVASTRGTASLGSAGMFVRSANSFKLLGPDQVNGAAATHYAIVVDVSKLPTAFPAREALVAAGLGLLPVDLWIDGQGRPIKVLQKFSVHGSAISSAITLSNFNAPLHITAPPADQVSNG